MKLERGDLGTHGKRTVAMAVKVLWSRSGDHVTNGNDSKMDQGKFEKSSVNEPSTSGPQEVEAKKRSGRQRTKAARS